MSLNEKSILGMARAQSASESKSFMDMEYCPKARQAAAEKMAEELLFCHDLKVWLAIYGPQSEESGCLITGQGETQCQ